jgi:hypothetical protein
MNEPVNKTNLVRGRSQLAASLRCRADANLWGLRARG